MLGEIRGEVRFKEPLSFHTSLRIGGPADFFIVPQDVEDIRLALAFADKEQLAVEVVGGGNNLLVRDRGIRGVVLRLEGCLGRAEFHGEEAVAGDQRRTDSADQLAQQTGTLLRVRSSEQAAHHAAEIGGAIGPEGIRQALAQRFRRYVARHLVEVLLRVGRAIDVRLQDIHHVHCVLQVDEPS